MIHNTKKTLLTLLALLTLAGGLKAQVFILSEEDYENSSRTPSVGGGPFVPYQGGDADQTPYVPLGCGLLLLTALGGAYLVGKRRKKNGEAQRA